MIRMPIPAAKINLTGIFHPAICSGLQIRVFHRRVRVNHQHALAMLPRSMEQQANVGICPSALRLRRIRQARGVLYSVSIPYESHCISNGHPLFRHGSQQRSEEHTSELQSLMRTSYAVFCLKKKKNTTRHTL